MRCKKGAFSRLKRKCRTFQQTRSEALFCVHALTLSGALAAHESASVDNLWIFITFLQIHKRSQRARPERKSSYAILCQSQRNKHKFAAIIMFLMAYGSFCSARVKMETTFIGIYGTSSGERAKILHNKFAWLGARRPLLVSEVFRAIWWDSLPAGFPLIFPWNFII